MDFYGASCGTRTSDLLIEDQVAPKRCGHTPGKEVVSRDEAFDRVRAAVDARKAGADILILARTDARHSQGLTEAIDRAATFAELGADILFVEAPKDEAEMRMICSELPLPNMANIVEGGETPDLPPEVLHDIGYKIVAYPLSLMAASMKAMVETLDALGQGVPRNSFLMDFGELRDRIGFNDYYETSETYASSRRS